MVSICTGAFVLAAAGVLDGRRATTHWRHTTELRARYPEVDLDPNVLYVDEGRVLTSAGVAAGIDLCLYLVARDHGTAAANAIARRMVVAPHRGGGQAQFVERAVPERSDDGLGATRTWMLERLERPLTVSEMARHARPQRALVRPPLPRRDREHAAALAARAAHPPRPPVARGHRPGGRGRRLELRLRHRREPARALPPRHAHDADGLPPGVQRRRAVTSISTRMRGSDSPHTCIVAAGRASANACRSSGQHGSKSSRSGSR